jgi:hypothetical protein
MVTVALLGEPIVYAALLARVTLTVSLPSTRVSLRGVTVRVVEEAPLGMVAVPARAV